LVDFRIPGREILCRTANKRRQSNVTPKTVTFRTNAVDSRIQEQDGNISFMLQTFFCHISLCNFWYIAFIFVSVHYCILLKEFVTYTQFPITSQVENTFTNSHALFFSVHFCKFSPLAPPPPLFSGAALLYLDFCAVLSFGVSSDRFRVSLGTDERRSRTYLGWVKRRKTMNDDEVKSSLYSAVMFDRAPNVNSVTGLLTPHRAQLYITLH